MCYNVDMENINLVIGNNIKMLRKANKLTQYELSEKLNYSNKAISRWESGDVTPDIQTLNKLSEIFNVPISKLFEENMSTEKIKKSYKIQIGTKLAISLLAVLLVWFVATIGFVYIGIIRSVYYWQIFIVAIPVTCIVGIIFNSIWGKLMFNFLLISVLVWSALSCVYIGLIQYNIWPIFLLGVPMQIGVILWSTISRNMQNKNKD